MLISRVSDEAEGGEGRAGADCGDHTPEYQTASELFELMTKNTHFDAVHKDSLTTRDLVLLYKNIDIGTKLINDATGIKHKRPNQYVETIVYNDEPDSESDSEMFCAEDLNNIFMLNQKRLDFLNDKSLENLLCPKFGGVEIQTSEMSMDYDSNLFFKDPYLKNELKNLNIMPSSSDFGNILSTSLIDYICCKRLEDNYNFYMENIITYVRVTIEQLKRISNGDYLTDRAKEKWREVNSCQQEENTKVLAASTSIPLHVQCKRNGSATWDDIVHSEVDIRSLSKILEKKIVVEIPKLICGSFRLYSKQCNDNIIISCQREQQQAKQNGQESRVDVVLQIQRSQTGQVMSNISSVMILRTSPALPDLRDKETIPMICNEETDNARSSKCMNIEDNPCSITGLSKHTNDVIVEELDNESRNLENIIKQKSLKCEELPKEKEDNYPFTDERPQYVSCGSNQIMCDSSPGLRNTLGIFPAMKSNEATINLISPDELRVTMQRLNKQFSVLHEGEEGTSRVSSPKRRSPVRARIKSPYENKSYLLEDKKRRKLLEIRERREKKKMALSEKCKISKHKYVKGAIMASSSVTKLSITNKSFYNSIYGQSFNVETKPKPDKPAHKGHKSMITPPAPDVSPVQQTEEECIDSPMLTPGKNSQKYTNRSYYLDDAETEMMYQMMQNHKDVQNTSASNSVVSNEFNANLNSLTQVMGSSDLNLNNGPTNLGDDRPQSSGGVSCSGGDSLLVLPIVDCVANSVAANPANDVLISKKGSTSDECRKSIDQLYDLITTLGKPKPNASADSRITESNANICTSNRVRSCSTIQASDSGTSMKHTMTSSNHSCFSGDQKDMSKTNENNHSTVVPNVIISSKVQAPKIEAGNTKRDRRKTNLSPPNKRIHENPLKAISQLLHEFNNVQKTRQKSVSEVKPAKKLEVPPNDVKASTRQGYRRRSRLDQHQDNDQEKKSTQTHITSKDKKARPIPPAELVRMPHLQTPVEDKNVDKLTKIKIADMIDEAREARGEAVRGPSKLNSRLNSLAQPKRSYVQAHHEEYQNRYGRNMVAERLQRLAAHPPDRNVASPVLRSRPRRSGAEATGTASVNQPQKQPPRSPHLDKCPRNTKLRRSPDRSAREFPWQPTATSSSCGPGSPGALKKMVAVKSYLKSHYGRSPSPSRLASGKSRTPLMPQDLDLASLSSTPRAEEAAALGRTLHCMVNSMVAGVASLTALTEGPESTSKASRSDPDSISPEHSETDSDYHFDILEDKLCETVVETMDETDSTGQTDSLVCSPPPHQSLNSTAELKKLENALYTQISGAFQKRLRIKNLTLTPKHSMQQVFLVHSGDAGSLLFKSTVSKLKMNKCSAKSLHDLKALPVLSNSHVDWAFTQIPIQIATVGYAFPEYRAQKGSSSQVKLLEVSTAVNSENVRNFSTSDVCFQCIHQKILTDCGAQVDVEKEIVEVSVGSSTDSVTIPQMTHEIKHIGISNQTSDVLETVMEIESADDSDTNKAIEEPIVSVKDEEIKESRERPPCPEKVEYTTSLDMLMGILNEIKKITCQNQMATANNVQTCANLETILNDAAGLKDKNKLHDIISMTSLDNLRKLESDASIYSCYISNGGDAVESNLDPLVDESELTPSVFDESAETKRPIDDSRKELVDENIATEDIKPPTVDKEVSAYLNEKECVDTFTNVSLSLAPLAVNRTAGETTVAIDVISEPSTQSVLSCADYQTLYCNRLFMAPSINKIVELYTQIEANEQHVQISRDKTDLNVKYYKTRSSNIEVVKKEKSLIARSELRKYCAKNVDLDPMLKIKRDLLVTVYSILVLTVFAALSFPELIVFEQ